MSLRSVLLNSVEDLIKNFSNLLAEKFELDPHEVYKLWDESNSVKSTPLKSTTVQSNSVQKSVDLDDISMERLSKANKTELAALCKARAIKCSGKKEELIERLLEVGKKKTESKTETKESKTESKKAPVKARDFRESKKEAKNFEAKAEVVQKVTSTAPEVIIRRSKHSNYIHPDSKLVFNSKTKNVIGKEEDDGTVSELCDEDIEVCKKYKFPYTIPNNLDKTVNIENVKVDELEDIEKEVEEVDEDEQENDDDEEVVELEDD